MRNCVPLFTTGRERFVSITREVISHTRRASRESGKYRVKAGDSVANPLVTTGREYFVSITREIISRSSRIAVGNTARKHVIPCHVTGSACASYSVLRRLFRHIRSMSTPRNAVLHCNTCRSFHPSSWFSPPAGQKQPGSITPHPETSLIGIWIMTD